MLHGAIIGFGEVARHGHWPAYRNARDVEIVAVVDPGEERRALAQKLIPEATVLTTLNELNEKTGIDFVDICTPPALHGRLILEALDRGWNVLCEKPLLLDLNELERVRFAANESGLAIVPVHNWKYAPLVRHATKLLRADTIGQLRKVEIQTLRVQASAVADPTQPNWRRDPAVAGGGILMDHGWHAIYLAQHWLGGPAEITRVKLRSEGRPAPTSLEVEDEVELTLRFARGEADIFLTWRANQRRNSIRMIGEKGEILLDDDTLKIGDETIRFEFALSAGSHHADWFAAMLPDVIENFRRPETARESFEEAAGCLSIIRAAYRLAKE